MTNRLRDIGILHGFPFAKGFCPEDECEGTAEHCAVGLDHYRQVRHPDGTTSIEYWGHGEQPPEWPGGPRPGDF